ncbi:MAG: universal stress protein [Rhodocyclaceae bacterium]|nr:universal stress protein [Rhodocyclaceae bacterium]
MNATTAAGHRPSTRRAPPAASIHGEQIMSEGEAAATGRPLRLLVPVNANDDSRWGITYALRLHAQGRAVEVCCLNVGEPVTQWEVLRFRTQAEIARFQAERAQAFIEEACAPLSAGHIPCRGFFKWGGVVFSILDTAEELACDAIVMPPPVGGLLGLFSKEIVVAVIRKSRNIPVITVGRQGMPVPPADGGDITH